MGSNCSPDMANLCLSHMEFIYMSNPANAGPAKQLSNTVRYIDDVNSLGSDALITHYSSIYPPSLPLSFDDTADGTGHFLDLLIDRNKKEVTLFDKRKEFKFEVIRFPFKDSNQPINLGLNVLYAQTIRIARICSTKDEFLSNFAQLHAIIIARGYSKVEIERTVYKVRKRYPLLFRRFHVRNDHDVRTKMLSY